MLLSEEFDLVSIHGEVGDFLEFERGTLSSNFLSLVSEQFHAQVWTALNTARRDNRPVELHHSAQDSDEGHVTILAEPIISSGQKFFLIYFIKATDENIPRAERTEADIGADVKEQYQHEITILQQQLQAVIEKKDTSHEELQTANEEVLSANEELQSSNEELETSRGELQSVNQELAATNGELEGKIKELEAANDDLSSLINSTDIPTVFLDHDLNIRRYSTRTTDLLRIRPGDIGRPLEDLASRVDDPNLLDDMHHVLDTLESVEREVVAEQATYQRSAAPFMSSKGKVQGVIVTYSDVTRLRDFASRLQRQACCQASVVNLGQRALESEDLGLLFDEICAEMAQVVGADYVGIQRHDAGADRFSLIAGYGWPRGIAGATQTPAAEMNELRYAMTHHRPVVIEDMSIEMRFAPSQLVRDVSVHSGICLAIGPVAAPWGVLNMFWQDETALDEEKINYIISVTSILWLAINQSQVKLMREGERAELQELIDGLPIMVAVVGADMQVDLFNKAWQDIGVTSEETRGAVLTDLLGPSARQISDRIKALSQKMQREGFEFSISVPGRGERVHLLYCVPRFVNGQPQGFFFAAIDINERKEWEERNRVISAELDHRVKNILALVNTIARMTGRNARDYEEFKEVFANRIDSMARTHSHLAAEKWDGTELRHLISEELEAYAVPDVDSITLEGPRVTVGPAAAQSIALAIHEMTTNAAKYGALAQSGGKLLVRWETGKTDVHLIWSETGVGSVAEPERTGFGATVVKNAIVNQMHGSLEMQFGEDGLEIDISIPLASIRANTSGE